LSYPATLFSDILYNFATGTRSTNNIIAACMSENTTAGLLRSENNKTQQDKNKIKTR
jgi:hypothetical protein